MIMIQRDNFSFLRKNFNMAGLLCFVYQKSARTVIVRALWLSIFTRSAVKFDDEVGVHIEWDLFGRWGRQDLDGQFGRIDFNPTWNDVTRE